MGLNQELLHNHIIIHSMRYNDIMSLQLCARTYIIHKITSLN